MGRTVQTEPWRKRPERHLRRRPVSREKSLKIMIRKEKSGAMP
ncbi:MAG: hypothetical protein SNJ57_03450 [Cyanobacteriota bacterium]